MTPKLLPIFSIILILASIQSLNIVNEKSKLTYKRLFDIFKRRPTNNVEKKINDEEDRFFKDFSQNFLKIATVNENDHHVWKSLLKKWIRDEEIQSKLNQKETNFKVPILLPYEYKIRSG
jgi:hypothetical protein